MYEFSARKISPGMYRYPYFFRNSFIMVFFLFLNIMSIIIAQIAEKIKGFRHQKGRDISLPIFLNFEKGVQGEKLFSEKFFPLQIFICSGFMYRIDALHDSSEERVHVVAADVEIREDREDVGFSSSTTAASW